MDKLLPVIKDLILVFFNLYAFTQMVVLRKDDRWHRIVMYGGCGAIFLLYFLAAYVLEIPVSVVALICVGFPSLLLFYVLSRYQRSRFFLTVCMVDTVMLIVGFVLRWIDTVVDRRWDILMLPVIVAGFTALSIFCKPYFKKYHELLRVEDGGWLGMALTAIFIYVALVFTAVYPKPLLERIEYGPSYLALCTVVLACYSIALKSVLKTKVIYQQNKDLLREKKFHRIAYTDMLTGLSNRAAYMERLADLEREADSLAPAGILVLDMNSFKQVNDRYGHAVGDQVLQYMGNVLRSVFSEETYGVYRIGGDEFVVIACPAAVEQLWDGAAEVARHLLDDHAFGFPVEVAAGVAVRRKAESMEAVFVRADQEMYRRKTAMSEARP